MTLTSLTGSFINQISPASVALIGLIIFTSYIILDFQTSRSRSLPFINGRKLFEFSHTNAKERYRMNAQELLQLGLKRSKAFYFNTDSGPVLILANEYARQIYNNPYLNVSKAVGAELHCEIPGMEGYRDDYFPDHFGIGVVRKKIGGSLGILPACFESPSPTYDLEIELESQLEPMSREVSSFLENHWTNDPEWHRISPYRITIDMVTQLTAQLRSGKELSQNPEWHRLCVEFPSDIYIAAKDLDKWPKFLHHVVHWFLRPWQKLRADIEVARGIFTPVVRARMAKKREATANGEEPPIYHDMIYWLDEGANGRPFDAAMAQLITAQAAIPGASDLITQILFDISERPQLAEDLRAEILSVIGVEGLTKTSLSNLHLMDSVAKESQRVKMLFSAGVWRHAEQSITLSDGVVIPRGSLVAIAMDHMWNESIYPDPLVFQSDRFLKWRQLPGRETAAKLTAATADHLAFGLGRHACPGRFYVAILIKLSLCHILLKYDLRLVGGRPAVEMHGLQTAANHKADIEVRRRREEIKLEI